MTTEYRVLDSKVLVVAMDGAIGDWAAYIGAVPGKDFDTEYIQVAEKGTKLHQRIAEILFPTWKSKNWRD